MPLCFGRKPAVFTARSMRSAIAMARALDPLGPPPDHSNDYVAAVTRAVGHDWGMLGNGDDPKNPSIAPAGDCTMADTGHSMMLRTANASQIIIPTAQQVLAAYSARTGYDPSQTQPDGSNPTDNGDDETGLCAWLQTVGFLGHKSAGTGSIDPHLTDHIKWCVQLFGTCRLGIYVPQSAVNQYHAGQVWDDVGDTNIVGGHDVPVVRFWPHMYCVVTWGKLQAVTPRFLARYMEEAHVELYPDFIRAQGTAPSGIDFATLEADLKHISAT